MSDFTIFRITDGRYVLSVSSSLTADVRDMIRNAWDSFIADGGTPGPRMIMFGGAVEYRDLRDTDFDRRLDDIAGQLERIWDALS